MIGPAEFGCPFCDRIAKTKQNMQNHIRVHTGEKPFICQFCNSGFTNKSHLNRHILLHTGETPFACNYCDFRSNRKDKLTGVSVKIGANCPDGLTPIFSKNCNIKYLHDI